MSLMRARRVLAVALMALAGVGSFHAAGPGAARQEQQRTGILLLAHGGSQVWNDNVRALATTIDREQPVEVAFGMATRANIQQAADALVARGVTEIVAVPLFVSSHSSVVTSTEFLLGLRKDAPPDLAMFAKMKHPTPAATGTAGAAASPAGHGVNHHDHGGAAAADGTKPITTSVPIRMTGALDSHPIVAGILADRAKAISTDPAREAVILVAHGPVNDEENRKWLASMETLGRGIARTASFASIDSLTVRDDAPAPIRDAATAELRALVQKRRDSGSRVLIVPVLLSFGGIEQGIRKRLEGLDYVMAAQAIMPDDRLVAWVKQQASRP